MKRFEALENVDSLAVYGRVAQAVGTVIEGYGPVTSIGEMGEVIREDGEGRVLAEVVGFRGERLLLMPLGEMRGIGPTSRLVMTGRQASVPVGTGLLGRVLDGLGTPIDRERTDPGRSAISLVCRSYQPLASSPDQPAV